MHYSPFGLFLQSLSSQEAFIFTESLLCPVLTPAQGFDFQIFFFALTKDRILIQSSNSHKSGTWRSLVAHLNGVQGVASSNPAVPTSKDKGSRVSWGPFLCLLLSGYKMGYKVEYKKPGLFRNRVWSQRQLNRGPGFEILIENHP